MMQLDETELQGETKLGQDIPCVPSSHLPCFHWLTNELRNQADQLAELASEGKHCCFWVLMFVWDLDYLGG
jgi:hypothetical protein